MPLLCSSLRRSCGRTSRTTTRRSERHIFRRMAGGRAPLWEVLSLLEGEEPEMRVLLLYRAQDKRYLSTPREAETGRHAGSTSMATSARVDRYLLCIPLCKVNITKSVIENKFHNVKLPRYNWDPLALDPEMTESLARTAPFSSQGEGVVQPRRLRARRSSDGFAGCHRPFPSATTTGWMWVSYPTAARCAPPPRRCFCHLERLLVSVSSVRWHAIGGIERRSSHRHRASSGRPTTTVGFCCLRTRPTCQAAIPCAQWV